MKREGKDISIITWSREVNFSLEAAAKLAQEGIEAEVLDLRTLVPLDWDAIVKTVSKTHNAIIRLRGGQARQLRRRAFRSDRRGAVRRAGRSGGACLRPEHLLPFSPVLEDKNFPTRRISWLR